MAAATLPAAAQDATWLANPGSGDFNTAANWSPASVPTGTASFGASTVTSLSFSANATVGGWTFNPGASAYIFTTGPILTFGGGAGIVVNGGAATILNNGQLNFANASTAGAATINNSVGSLNFLDTSTAGNAAITNNSNSSAGLSFFNTSTAGNAAITNNTIANFFDASTASHATITNNAVLNFVGFSTAGNASISNNFGSLLNFSQTSAASSATITNAGIANFNNASTAGNATIDNRNGLVFSGTSTAGTATITNNNGGATANLSFTNGSTAGTAAITNFSNSSVNFLQTSTAGTAAIINNSGGFLTFSDASTAGGATIANSGTLQFFGTSTAGNATITNHGALNFVTGGTAANAAITNDGALNFNGTSTAGSAAIDNTGGAAIFSNTSTAGSAAITNTNNGVVIFTNGSTAGNATIVNNASTGAVVFSNTSAAGSATITNNAVLNFADSSTAGHATIANNANLNFRNTSSAGGAITNNFGGFLSFFDASTAGTAVIGNAGIANFNGTTSAANATIANTASGALQFFSRGTAGNAAIANNGNLSFFNNSTAGSATVVNNASLFFNDASTAGNAAITNNVGGHLNFLGASTASTAIIVNKGSLFFLQDSTAGNATVTTDSGGLTAISGVVGGTPSGGNARFITNAGGTFDISQLTTAGTTAGSIEGAGTYSLGGKQLTVGSNDLSTTVSGTITDGGLGGGSGGSLVKAGAGTLTLAGTNSFTGGTTVLGGLINFAAAGNFGSGVITLNGGGLQWAAGNTSDISSRLMPLGPGAGTFDTNGNSVTLASSLSGPGALTKQGSGTLNLAAHNIYTGPTSVLGGALSVNGSITSNVTVGAAGTLGGNGTIFGSVVNAGALAPGNSIGTLAINGNYTQSAGSTYQVELNAAGQGDRINVGGAATIQGGTVQVLAQPGNYGPRTTYTILNAAGGVNGTYSGVSSNFAFLVPSLSYDVNDVYLTLALQAFTGITPNQKAVAAALNASFDSAAGDYATVIGALAGLSLSQAPAALDAISGQQYAGFGNAMVQGAQLFLTNFANRAGRVRGSAAKVALAEACDVACDATTPAVWGLWGGAVGGAGTIAGNQNAGTFTYSVGGFSVGLDRKFTPNFLAGVTVGYQTGGQWTGGFEGRSVTDSVQAGIYASFTEGPIYVDAIAAYAYSANQMWRNINISGLQPRMAYGQTSANQFLGQLETGYRMELGGMAEAYVMPFALVQGSTATQNAFTETGAQSLNLNVAQQTISSLRTVFGAQLGGAMDVGFRDKIAAQLRLGWSHEFADTTRPVTAAFVGAPAAPFTVQGAAPTRDGVVIGVSASTAVADALGVYLRYEGTIAGQDSSHALIAGLRMTW